MKVTPARRAALAALGAVGRGTLLDAAAAKSLEGLPPRERAWAHELLYGTVRLRGRLDTILAPLVRGGLEGLDPVVLDALRLGSYQLLEMGSVPAYAAVSQSVELVRSAGAAPAAGLVNAVLQRLAREGAPEPPPPGEAPERWLATWGSHPRWLVRRWLDRFGMEDTLWLVEADNTPPELFLRPLGIDPAAAIARLEEAGIRATPVDWAPDSLRVLPPAGPAQALAAVPAVVQDPAAAVVARYAELPAGALVADVCAAPGGKALALASPRYGSARAAQQGALAAGAAGDLRADALGELESELLEGGAGYLVAADLSPARLQRVRQNLRRVGRLPVGLLAADARQPAFRPVDGLIVDAPCTGTGTLRRHPDGKWRLSAEDLSALAALQREILAGVADRVRPGGLLVYATCSLEREENEEQVEDFIERHPRYRLEPPHGLGPALLDGSGYLRVLPQRHGADGAFAARLRREG